MAAIKKNEGQGIAQSGRVTRGLMPDYIKIDERKISDLMAYTVEFAQYIHFYNQKNEIDGNWVNFFKNDMSFFLSSIMAINLRTIENERLEILKDINPILELNQQKIGLQALFQHTFGLAEKLNDWYHTALKIADRTLDHPEGIEEGLENIIGQQMATKLQKLKAYDEGASLDPIWGKPFGGNYYPFLPIWDLKDTTPVNIFEGGKNPVQQIQFAVKKIRLIYRSFFNSISFIVNNAEAYLKESLVNKQNHQPGTALFIAFLQLFSHAKEHLNGMTKQHLDYYYYQILQQKMQAAISDKVHVFFDPAPKGNHYLVEKGSKLLAGRDENGVENLFTTDHDLTLSKTKITELKSIFLERNEQIGVGSTFQLITNIYAAPIANSSDGVGGEFAHGEAAWPLFGEQQFDKRADERFMKHADLGFAIASPILDLSEGNRKVSLVFRFEKQSASTFLRLIRDISINEKIGRKDAVVKVLQDSLILETSSTEAWFQIPAYEVSIPETSIENLEFTLSFTLQTSDPPLANYDPEVLGDALQTRQPVVKVKLRAEDCIYGYSFLRDLMVETILIHVDVKGVKNLELYNDLGKLDVSLPFQPFGAMPKVGAYFLIGKSELFRKELTDLNLHFDWYNLPQNVGGLADYYKDYQEGVQNEDFLVSLSALSGNIFTPKDAVDQQQFELFNLNESSSILEQNTHFNKINLGLLEIRPDSSLEELSAFDGNTRSGFLKFELTGPKMAFGHDIFPKLFTEVTMGNAQIKSFGGISRKASQQAIPENPFYPIIRKVTLDYKASAVINVLAEHSSEKNKDSPDEIFHIEPFGNSTTFIKNRAINRFMLPQFNHHGYLYMGVKDLNPPEKLSLLFQMEKSKAIDTFFERPDIIWWHLEGHHWSIIPEESILLETTEGFTNSGIVSIKLPQKTSKGFGVHNPDLHWLRITLDGNNKGIPHVKQIHVNAVSCTWLDNGNQRDIKEFLPPDSIKGLQKSKSEIKAVRQPYPSFGGKSEENEVDFYTRISERLRHKNRAVSLWDYERLILQNFPDLLQVKCIAHQGHEAFVEPGTVVVIVVPKLRHQHTAEPQIGYNVLQEVKDFLSSFASPFVTIEVRNPTYERLKISSGIIFHKGKSNGNYIEQLNREIRDFVCPWMYSQKATMNIGGGINKNELLNFIKNRSYVKFVTKFSVVQIYTNTEGATYEDTAINDSYSPFIQSSTPWSVLVPLPDHPIVFWERSTYQSPDPAAIETMILETDFILKSGEETREQEEHTSTHLPKMSAKKQVGDKVFFLKIKRG